MRFLTLRQMRALARIVAASHSESVSTFVQREFLKPVEGGASGWIPDPDRSRELEAVEQLIGKGLLSASPLWVDVELTEEGREWFMEALFGIVKMLVAAVVTAAITNILSCSI